jgi:pSer/pThr/pTyr-binding forkhead associated (FHA) protein
MPNLSDAFEKLGRAIFERPFQTTAGDLPELAEVRLAVLDAVKSKSHHVRGVPVFPYNYVRIHLRGVPETQAESFRTGFLARYFDDELRQALTRSSYRCPEELEVEFQTTPALPTQGEDWITVEVEARAIPETPVPAIDQKPMKLVILKGTANVPELPLTKSRTNIGRGEEVFRSAGPARRNDLAFTESDEPSRSVSREHAHILHDKKTNEYRLINDRWYKATPATADANCGLWIVRDGLSQPVHRGPRGVLLQDGDEIHLGQAVLRLQPN